MKVIYSNSETKEIKEVNYPAIDISIPVLKLDKAITYYFIEILAKPKITNNFERIVKAKDILTDEYHSIYTHLKICKRGYTIIRMTNEEIIRSLSENLGQFLDNEYPIATREKHNFELQSVEISKDRMDYLLSLRAWLEQNRMLRDELEANFLNKNILPELNNWIKKPE
jgi:hypothetical protein